MAVLKLWKVALRDHGVELIERLIPGLKLHIRGYIVCGTVGDILDYQFLDKWVGVEFLSPLNLASTLIDPDDLEMVAILDGVSIKNSTVVLDVYDENTPTYPRYIVVQDREHPRNHPRVYNVNTNVELKPAYASMIADCGMEKGSTTLVTDSYKFRITEVLHDEKIVITMEDEIG